MWAKIAMGAGFAALVAFASPAFAETRADYFGHWVNVNPGTKSLVSVDITNGPGNSIQVHPYGKCHPTPCDWGVQTATPVPGPGLRYRVIFDQDFATKTLDLDIPTDKLRIRTSVHFTDGSGREDYLSIDRFNH